MDASLSNEVTEVLSRNGAFYRDNPDDSTSHYIDPATIKHFAEQILSLIVVPIFSAGVGAAVSEYVKNRMKKGKEKTLTTDEFIALWKTVSAGFPLEKDAVEQVKDKLRIHGWPKLDAETDAVEVVRLSAIEQLKDHRPDEPAQ